MIASVYMVHFALLLRWRSTWVLCYAFAAYAHEGKTEQKSRNSTKGRRENAPASPYKMLLAVQVLWDELSNANAPQCEQGPQRLEEGVKEP